MDDMHAFMARNLAFLHQNTKFCRSDTDELRLSELHYRLALFVRLSEPLSELFAWNFA